MDVSYLLAKDKDTGQGHLLVSSCNGSLSRKVLHTDVHELSLLAECIAACHQLTPELEM